MRAPSNYVIGFDYGSNSCRAVMMRIGEPDELVTAVFNYPSGSEGIVLDAADFRFARQNPDDYIAGFHFCVREVLASAAACIEVFDASLVRGIAFATTGSTVIPVDAEFQPLSRRPEFAGNPNALAWLWKDHTSEVEAKQITNVLREMSPELLERCGGQYSSEWFWAKILRLSRIDPGVFKASANFLELCEFLPIAFTERAQGSTPRSICALGHKALYVEALGGLPSVSVLGAIDPVLADLRSKLAGTVASADQPVGRLRGDIARELGLDQLVVVAGGAFDAHVGSVGAGIRPGRLVKVMGTSTCDIMIAAEDVSVKGVCGIFRDSVVPGFNGIEAGQSAVGDLFKWFVQNSVPASYGDTDAEKFDGLTTEAAQHSPGQSGLVVLDWHNGNRTVLVDMDLNGLTIGQTLHTTAAEVFRALVEATAFGALAIINRLEASGVLVEDIVCCGGLARKNPMLMQIYADVCNRPISVAGSTETCAKGAAIFAAAASGGGSLEQLRSSMVGPVSKTFHPHPEAQRIYANLFEIYGGLHDAFGIAGSKVELSSTMKKLNLIRREARHG